MKDITKSSALLIIDVQNDFCPGGALEVSNGDQIIGPINDFQLNFDNIVNTQDWHPRDHKCFAKNHGLEEYSTIEFFYGTQILWPEHCIQNTIGSALHDKLDTTRSNLILRKGLNKNIDSYSAFFENDKETPTGLDGYLKSKSIENLYICGLAFDFCVFYTAMDGIELGYNVFVLENLSKAIDLNSSKTKAKKSMLEKNIKIITDLDN